MAAVMAVGGCSLTPPPRPPEDEQALRLARRSDREAEQAKLTLEAEQETVTTELEQIRAELESLDEPQQAALAEFRAQQLAFDMYWRSIEAATNFADRCADEADSLTAAETGYALLAGLADFVSEPRRDEALAAMERCRKVLATQARKQIKVTVKDLQVEFAVAVEDTFDENNPYSRGNLSAAAKGSTLNVRMRGNFEGRARHSQDQVDGWCASSEGLFTKVTLKNSHGTFSCRPSGTPRDLIDSVLEDANLLSSWLVTGDEATPTKPGDPPAPTPETERRRAELIAEARRIEAGVAEFGGRGQSIDQQQADARQTVDRLDRKHQRRVEDWGQTRITRAGNAQIAGVVFVALGGVVLIGSVAAQQSSLAGARKFLPIGLGVSIPVVLTGVLFLIAGGVRKQRLRETLGCASATSKPSYCQPSR